MALVARVDRVEQILIYIYPYMHIIMTVVLYKVKFNHKNNYHDVLQNLTNSRKKLIYPTRRTFFNNNWENKISHKIVTQGNHLLKTLPCNNLYGKYRWSYQISKLIKSVPLENKVTWQLAISKQNLYHIF